MPKERKISICISSLQDRFGDEEALRIVKRIGADGVDFDTHSQDHTDENSIFSKSEDEIRKYYSSLKKRAEELGIAICQTHGRFRTYTADRQDNIKNMENLRLDLLAASCLGAPYCVIHNVTTAAMGPECDPKVMRDLSFDMFCAAIPMAKKYGVKLATETFGDSPRHGCCDFFGQSNEFLMNYNRVCAVEDFSDWLVTCADTGHSNKAMRFGQPNPGDVIRLLGSTLGCLHLNDNDTLTDQHKPPLAGTIDWYDVISALDEVGYSGYYNMELALYFFGKELIVETAEYSIKVLKNLFEAYDSGVPLK